MTRILKHVLVLLLVIGIAFVFISPVLQLQPTAMRAWQAAQMAMIGLVLSATAIVRFCDEARLEPVLSDAVVLLDDTTDLIDLNCSRLC